MATLLDIITDALAAIGQSGIGQSVSPEQAQQGLRVANRMLAKWSLQKFLIPVVTQRSFNLSATVQDYTVGPTGAFVGTRPLFIESGVAIIPGTQMQQALNILDKTQWDAIPDTGIICGTNGAPTNIWPEYTYPNLTFHVSAIPSTIVRVILGAWEYIQQFTEIYDLLTMPPGYEEAFAHGLSYELAVYYQLAIQNELSGLAVDALNTLKTNNAQRLRGALGESQTLVSPNVGIPQATAGQ